MPDNSLSALRREALTRAWRVSASMSPCGLQVRLIVNAMREAGGATELTSTAYLVSSSQAGVALARIQAEKLGCPGAAIRWSWASLSNLGDSDIAPAIAA